MLLLALALGCRPGETPDVQPEDWTWSGDVALDADFVVPVGETLTIEAGTTISLAADVALLVDGELLAVGTPDAPIVFTGDAATPWRSIVFSESAIDAVFEGVDAYASGSIVEHAVVEHALRGMEVQSSAPYLHGVTFRGNAIPLTIDPIGGAGLLVRDGATPRIRECSFLGNTADTFAFGGALYVHHADPIVQDCVFDGNDSTYGGAIATDFVAGPIVGSVFTGNYADTEGGAVSLVSTVSAFLGNDVRDNHAEHDGGGVHVCVTCVPHSAPYLYDNVITENLTDAATPGDGAGGLGAAYLGACEDNAIYGNLRKDVPSDFGWFNELRLEWPEWVATAPAAGNWWGTDDREAVDSAVFDGTDDPEMGLVTLDPIRTTAPSGPLPRAVIASRSFYYEYAGEEIPVFLTVYNPGPETEAVLRIERGGQPFEGVLDYPGAAEIDGGWSLTLPENSVWFATLETEMFDGSPGEVSWTASLYEADGEMLLSQPTLARYYLVGH